MSDMKIKVILEEANVNKDFFTSNRKENNLKCPFCQQELKDQWVGQNVAHEYFDCPKCKMNGNPKLWQELIRTETENKDLSDKIGKLETELEKTRKALDYCIERFKSLENVLDEKAEASDIPDNPDLYAWAVRIKPIWGELKEITGIDYTTEHK